MVFGLLSFHSCNPAFSLLTALIMAGYCLALLSLYACLPAHRHWNRLARFLASVDPAGKATPAKRRGDFPSERMYKCTHTWDSPVPSFGLPFIRKRRKVATEQGQEEKKKPFSFFLLSFSCFPVWKEKTENMTACITTLLILFHSSVSVLSTNERRKKESWQKDCEGVSVKRRKKYAEPAATIGNRKEQKRKNERYRYEEVGRSKCQPISRSA
mmetsp:Transcript_15825/g.32097  ORF Transcript_15825/g.32097 Transcript_15825/m.32097 type:complete len:213 (-) Transcript_15825:2113-2751(-)